MRKFDHFELDPNNNRILACGESHKTPIGLLTSIATDGNRVIVFDDDKAMFVFEANEKNAALQKIEELNAFVDRYSKVSPSCFKP
jgi:hypothetical protein